MKGYLGKILVVNLTTGSIIEEYVPESVYEEYLSGAGLGAWYLYRNIPQGADPMGEENILGFVSGILTGTGSVMSGRWLAVTKSPITGGWGDANCGGTLAPAIKRCGYDAIFFKGIAEYPVYLHVDDSEAKLIDASKVWGLDTVETEEYLEGKHWVQKKPAVAVIGQAGENKSLISGICNDRGRIAARSGVGAVMGSKRLKAVVLTGTKPIGCHDSKSVRELSREFTHKIRNSRLPRFVNGKLLALGGKIMARQKNVAPIDGIMAAALIKKWGSAMSTTMGTITGDTPVKNWKGSVRDFNHSFYKHMNPDLIIKREYKKYHCYSCVLSCGGVCDIKKLTKGKFTDTHKPEYETVSSFAQLLMNKDLDSIFYINEMLNRAGMDSISAGHVCSFAMECYENGILTPADTDGLELTWGNIEAIIELLEAMINRKGVGELLADGVKVAALKIGRGSESFAMHCGGQEPGMHDSRFDPLLGVAYSADPTPGRHTVITGQSYNIARLWEKVSWAPAVGKYSKNEEYLPSDEAALKTIAGMAYKQLLDGCGVCIYGGMSGINHYKLFDFLNCVTGWNRTADEYMESGKRIQTTRHLFNIKHGVNIMDFRMKDRMAGIPPLNEGPLKGQTVPIDEMIRKYWKNFGWDENTGIPHDHTLIALNLKEEVLSMV